MMRATDLAPLIGQQPAPGVGFRQGKVVAWNPITAENTIDVGGTTLTDLPILNTAEAGLLNPDDVVALLTTGQGGAQSWWILGRVTIPNTPQAGSALSAWAARGKLAAAAATITFNSTSFQAPGDSSGPTITDFIVGNSGQALVFISAAMGVPGGSPAQSGIKAVWMGFELSGPTNLSASVERALACNVSWVMPSGASVIVGSEDSATKMVPLSGLGPGTYTLEAQYRINGGETQLAYAFDRSLFAVPI